MTQQRARQEAERRWIVLGTDGRHVSIGRDSDYTATIRMR